MLEEDVENKCLKEIEFLQSSDSASMTIRLTLQIPPTQPHQSLLREGFKKWNCAQPLLTPAPLRLSSWNFQEDQNVLGAQ